MVSSSVLDRPLSSADIRAESKRLAALTNPATMGRYLDPHRYTARAHHRLIGEALTGLGTAYDRCIITTPPQVGKSTLVSELLPFWWLAKHPSHRIGITSYSASLALKKSAAVRRHVRASGGRFGLAIQRGESSIYDWSTTSGGGVRAVGVGGSLTGFPITGVGIVDDPHKDRREADSLRMRDHVWNWWSSVFLTRLSPGAPVVIVLTRWHEDDLAGRVLTKEGDITEGGRWRYINLEAITTGGNDPLGRPPGAPLTHPQIPDTDTEALSRHWEDKRKSSNPRDWGALYQGNPQPSEGALITRAQLASRRCFKTTAEPERIAVAVDPNGGGRDTAGIVGGHRATDGRLYISHDRSGHMPPTGWSRAACLLAHEIGATSIVMETNYGGKMVPLTISTAWNALVEEGAIPEDALKPYLSTVHARSGKLLRAEPIAQQWLEDRIRTAAYLPELEEEWATWQPDATDSPGRLDASVYLGYALLRAPGTGQKIGNSAGVSISAAAQQAGGGLGSISLGRDR